MRGMLVALLCGWALADVLERDESCEPLEVRLHRFASCGDQFMLLKHNRRERFMRILAHVGTPSGFSCRARVCRFCLFLMLPGFQLLRRLDI